MDRHCLHHAGAAAHDAGADAVAVGAAVREGAGHGERAVARGYPAADDGVGLVLAGVAPFGAEEEMAKLFVREVAAHLPLATGEVGDRALGGGIGQQRRLGHVRIHRAGVDDAAARLQVRDRRLAQPEHGVEMADELENRIIALHGAANSAAVVIEPIACSTGVLVPPKGYLKRIRQICDRHQLLLIFDEVITGFGRTGNMFASTTFDVVPDMILFAKTVTNGAAPLGGVIVKRSIHDALMQGPPHLSELMHGYTYSGHPLACAAAIAMIDVIEQENLIDQVNTLSPYFEEAVHSLAELEQVVSIRNFGLAAGIELRAKDGAFGQRGFQAQALAFKHGVLTRAPGDTLVLAPPFITTRSQIDQMIDGFKKAIQETT